MWFGKDKSILGIDIGTSTIKMVQIDQDKKSLKTYGIVDLIEPITAQTSTEVIDQTAQLLSSLISKAGATTRKSAVSLPNSAVFTSVIELPKMADSELEQALGFEAKKYIPLPLSEVSLTWTNIADDAATSTMKILLIAVPKMTRDVFLKIFQQAGLDLEVVEIEPLALVRSLVTDISKNDVIIDIGAKVTAINFIKQGLLQLTRTINVGGDTLTDKIAQSLNLQFDRAEQFKRDFGLNNTEFLPETLKPVLSSIKQEVKQVIDIYKSHSINTDRIVLVGGGSQMPGITEFFKDLVPEVVLGSVLSRINYDSNIESPLKRYSTQLPIAIGLALREND